MEVIVSVVGRGDKDDVELGRGLSWEVVGGGGGRKVDEPDSVTVTISLTVRVNVSVKNRLMNIVSAGRVKKTVVLSVRGTETVIVSRILDKDV